MPQVKPTRGLQLNKTHRLSRGLVGCWLFNEGSGNIAQDLSGNNNTGTFVNTPIWVSGEFGSALEFQDGDYVNIGDVPALNITSDHTIIAMVKTNSAEQIGIYNKLSEPWNGIVFGFKGSTGDAGELSYYNIGSGWQYGDSAHNDGHWHQVVISVDVGVGGCFYVDGISDGSWADATSAPGADSADARIGIDHGNRSWLGQIGFILIYNRALSASEIALLYREPFCMFEREISPGLLYAPSGVDVTVEPAALALSAALQTPTLSFDYTVTPSALALALALQTPTVSVGWIGINSSHYDSHCGEDGGATLADALDGADAWVHSVDETHWFIVDLGQTYDVKKVRGRSFTTGDPIDVNIYVSNNKGDFGAAVASGVNTWQNRVDWDGDAVIDVTDKQGRYVKVEIVDTEHVDDYIGFGADPAITIFDVYGEPVENVTVEPSTLALALTLQTPTLAYDYTVTPSALALALTLETPSLHSSFTATPNALALALTLETPSIVFDYTVLPNALNLSLELLTPLIKTPGIFSIAAPEGELASMISRAVPKLSNDPIKMSREVQRILRQHFRDIQTLFATTTDVDVYEQHRIENE